MIALIAALATLWTLLNGKLSRPDGDLIAKVHPYRRLMAFVMRSRTESTVYLDADLRAEKLLEFLERHRARGITLTHLLVAAAGDALRAHPNLNRFVAGKRLYQRRGRHITFSMKRAKLDAASKVAVVKLELEANASLAATAQQVDQLIHHQRSGERTAADAEFGLLTRLPRPLLSAAVAGVRWLDHYNLLPRFFVAGDALYTSVFIANLGSLNMSAPYHHLYEWGNCPLFMGVGAIEERVVVRNGEVTTAQVLPIRWSFDERIEDGLSARGGLEHLRRVLEDPESAFSLIG